MQDDERAQLIQDYLDGHVSRGGILSDEVRAQAAHYAARVAESRAYEQQLKDHADAQRRVIEYAMTDTALRARSNRKQLMNSYINRFAGENAQITEEMKRAAALYADRVLASADPQVEQRAVTAAAERLAVGKHARVAAVAQLREELAAKAGSNHWRDLKAVSGALRRALDELDAQLFREAMTAPEGDEKEPGDGSDAPAQDRATIGRMARPGRRKSP